MIPRFTLESFDALAGPWSELQERAAIRYIFASPAWTRLCYEILGEGSQLLLGAVRTEESLIGIAPLALSAGTARFIGSPDVCDYLDCLVEPGRAADFYPALLDGLTERGINRLDLLPLRPEASARQGFAAAARDRGWAYSEAPDEVTVEMELPHSWDAYLEELDGKQRHEVRRKLRRLEEAGPYAFRTLRAPGPAEMAVFLELMRGSRPDKAAFLTPPREAFFQTLVEADTRRDLTLSFLDLKGRAAAAVLCFEDTRTVYLYNSGYDPSAGPDNTGLVCKLLRIRESIETGRRRFDFLKGSEEYKFRLGGRAVPLSRVTLSRDA